MTWRSVSGGADPKIPRLPWLLNIAGCAVHAYTIPKFGQPMVHFSFASSPLTCQLLLAEEGQQSQLLLAEEGQQCGTKFALVE